MNFLLFVLGSNSILHMQAHYALRTLYVHSTHDDKFFILTDSPILYENLPFVEVIAITAKDIIEWKGEYDYFFRIKINAIRKFVYAHSDKHLIYVDCDTYCIRDFSSFKLLLDKGHGIMHKDEGSIEHMKGDSQTMWKQTHGKKFAGITITSDYHMWNSGVLGIPKEHVISVMDKALEICDAFLTLGVTCFNMEQWAISIALAHYCSHGIEEGKKIIGHYWHHKYVWSRYIALFFADTYSHGRTLESDLHIIKHTNFHWLARRLATHRILMKIFCKSY